MKLNVRPKTPAPRTHEGAPADRISAFQQLRRTVLAHMLWEDSFYEDGESVAARMARLIPLTHPDNVVGLAIEARNDMYLRHVPLFLIRELARIKGNGSRVASALAQVIQRPDELTEYLAIYWKDGKVPLSAGSKRGLAAAIGKFSRQSLSKYDRDGLVKLRDVLRLVHAKPVDSEQSATYKMVIDRSLPTADTWETALSGGADKKATFERLLEENKLGGLAFLRNLRNMVEAGVSSKLIRERFKGNFSKVLPFRFIAAAPYAKSYIAELDEAMLRAASDVPKFPGHTIVMVDISRSMDMAKVSAKSELSRAQAACALAALVREASEECSVYSFSEFLRQVPSYRGMALIDAIDKSQRHWSTHMWTSIGQLPKNYDRLIVITDEQVNDRDTGVWLPKKAYMINVGTDKCGIGRDRFFKINGWSERVIDFIQAIEDIPGTSNVKVPE